VRLLISAEAAELSSPVLDGVRETAHTSDSFYSSIHEPQHIECERDSAFNLIPVNLIIKLISQPYIKIPSHKYTCNNIIVLALKFSPFLFNDYCW